MLTTEDGGESARLNAVHTIGFAEKAISIGEGMSATVRLSISPPAPADTMVTVDLSSSDEGRLAVAPSATFAPGADSATASLIATDNPDKEKGMEYAIFLSVPDRVPAYLRADTLRVTVSPDERDSSIAVTVEPTSLKLAEGEAGSITFTVPERFIIEGRATVRLTTRGDIAVAPTLIVLDGMMRATSALVTATRNDDAGGEPRPATVSLSVTGDIEDPV